MKQSVAMRIWNILYPIFIYYVVAVVVTAILDLFLPETADTKLLRQLLTSFAALPILYSYYKQDCPRRGKEKNQKPAIWSIIKIFIIGGCFAIAWNNLLGIIRIADYSTAYQQVEKAFYTGQLLLEILTLCVIIPIAEELLYRGIVYGRLKDWLGSRTAIVVSAVIFGLIHRNLVQFVYAAVFGLLLACFAEKTESLAAPIAAHIAANLTSVLRTETELFGFMDNQKPVMITGTVLLFGIAAIGILSFRKQG